MAVVSQDPTSEEVAAAIATLQAFEAAQHPVAAPVEPVKSSTEPAAQVEQPAAAAVAEATSAPAAIDPYLARSVKSSPNGF